MGQPFAVVAEVKEGQVIIRGIECIAQQEKTCWKYIQEQQIFRPEVRFKLMSVAQARTLSRFVYGRK